MRILLVEDERSASRMIAKGLREHGHAVDVVADGAAAIEHAETVTYDVVVLDLMLPVKSGLDVCRELRANGDPVPVLIAPVDRERVFERFVRLDPARSTGSGTGLGLPIARWIAEQHEGTLTLEQNEAGGCVFVVRLPMRHHPSGGALPRASRETARDTART
jgi:CheY-like chemotaxis protein